MGCEFRHGLFVAQGGQGDFALNSGGYWVRFLDMVNSFPKGSFRAYTTVQFLGSTALRLCIRPLDDIPHRFPPGMNGRNSISRG